MEWYVQPIDNACESLFLQNRQNLSVDFNLYNRLSDDELRAIFESASAVWNDLVSVTNYEKSLNKKNKLEKLLDVQKTYIALYKKIEENLTEKSSDKKQQYQQLMNDLKKASSQLLKEIDFYRRLWKQDHPTPLSTTNIGDFNCIHYYNSHHTERYKKNLSLSYLTEMYVKLHQNSIVVIHGLEGVGKSSLVKKYVNEATQNNAYDFNFIINAESDETIKNSYINAIKHFNSTFNYFGKTNVELKETLNHFLEQFQNPLFIFENAPTFESIKCMQLLPTNEHCIVITQSQPIEEVCNIYVDNFNENEACSYMKACLIKQFSTIQKNYIEAFCQKLEYNPKALSTAIDFFTIPRFARLDLDLFMQKLDSLLNDDTFSHFSIFEKITYLHLQEALKNSLSDTKKVLFSLFYTDTTIDISALEGLCEKIDHPSEPINSRFENCDNYKTALAVLGRLKIFTEISVNQNPQKVYVKPIIQKVGRYIHAKDLSFQNYKNKFFTQLQNSYEDYVEQIVNNTLNQEYQLLMKAKQEATTPPTQDDCDISSQEHTILKKLNQANEALTSFENSWKILCNHAKMYNVTLLDHNANFLHIKKRQIIDAISELTHPQVIFKEVHQISNTTFYKIKEAYVFDSFSKSQVLTLYNLLYNLYKKNQDSLCYLERDQFHHATFEDCSYALHLLTDLISNPNLPMFIEKAKTLSGASFFLRIFASQFDNSQDVIEFLNRTKKEDNYLTYHTLINSPLMPIYIQLSEPKKLFLKTVTDIDLNNISTLHEKVSDQLLLRLEAHKNKCTEVTKKEISLSVLFNTLPLINQPAALFLAIYSFVEGIEKNKLTAYDFLVKRLHNLSFFLNNFSKITDGADFIKIEPHVAYFMQLQPTQRQNIEERCAQLLDLNHLQVPVYQRFCIYYHFMQTVLNVLSTQYIPFNQLKLCLKNNEPLTEAFVNNLQPFLQEGVNLQQINLQKIPIERFLNYKFVFEKLSTCENFSFVINTCKEYINKSISENIFEINQIESYFAILCKVIMHSKEDILNIMQRLALFTPEISNYTTILNCASERYNTTCKANIDFWTNQVELVHWMCKKNADFSQLPSIFNLDIDYSKLNVSLKIMGAKDHIELVNNTPITRLITIGDHFELLKTTKIPVPMLLEIAIKTSGEEWNVFLTNPFNPNFLITSLLNQH